jgi:predicted N-acetyltransferase YhbS
VREGDAEERAAVHRAAWSPTSKVTTRAYERLMATPPYRPATDHVVIADDGEWVASCCVWLDEESGVALVEPVGCVEEHGGRGLAAAASVSALTAARDLGATTGLVCPRGDDEYPGPARLYRRIGFEPGPRTRTYRRSA